jgi:hypothetical protein
MVLFDERFGRVVELLQISDCSRYLENATRLCQFTVILFPFTKSGKMKIRPSTAGNTQRATI